MFVSVRLFCWPHLIILDHILHIASGKLANKTTFVFNILHLVLYWKFYVFCICHIGIFATTACVANSIKFSPNSNCLHEFFAPASYLVIEICLWLNFFIGPRSDHVMSCLPMSIMTEKLVELNELILAD